MNVTRTEAIKNFLTSETHADLASLYHHDMECQVNVAQDGGDRIEGDYKGRQWHGWTDNLQTWKSFRIPWAADTNPEFTDSAMSFDLAAHAEGIGMTGWNWREKKSIWVAFDFDSISGHSKGLTDAELKAIQKEATDLPWITVRKSTSGTGLHLYIFLGEPVQTDNHSEHAALARSILGVMAAVTGHDFSGKVDSQGGNMWCWHRKMQGTDGLQLIKEGEKFYDIPLNWKDHIKVITGKRKKILPFFVEEAQIDDIFSELAGQRAKIPLDDEHKKLISYLQEVNVSWWWDSDHHMLVTHTSSLAEAHEALNFRGLFKTIALGTEKRSDHNCFAFPLRHGAWVVRRYTRGCAEDPSWDQDGVGFTRTFLNKEPDLKIACRVYEGIEHPSGGFVFRHAELALKAAGLLGVNIKLPTWAMGRKARLREHKDGRLLVDIDHESSDTSDAMQGWLADKSSWKRLFNVQVSTPSEPETANYDDLVRHVVTETGDDYGWVIKSDNQWRNEPFIHVRTALEALGLSSKEAKTVLGGGVMRAWTMVNRPFQPEYIGDRQWNRGAAQFRFAPSEDKENLHYDNWSKILNHIGQGLEDAIRNHPWAASNGIKSGADYLKCWLASLFQEPGEPLPYLFLYGPQNSGKSIFHEAVSLLITSGWSRADQALESPAGFNGELEHTIFAIVEETDLRRNKVAYGRIKDWVTSKHLPIHRKNKTPYSVPNTLHFVQTNNDYSACPVFSGDTRVTMIFVPALDPIEMVPKKFFLPLLEKEASDFLASLLALEIPPSSDRLNVPVIITEEKLLAEDANMSFLEMFLKEECHYVAGEMVNYGEFYTKFQNWLDPNYLHQWTKIRVGRELPPHFPKGRNIHNGHLYIGNMSFENKNGTSPDKPKLILKDGKLISLEERKK
jgi:Family of unknown function (DUF5906)